MSHGSVRPICTQHTIQTEPFVRSLRSVILHSAHNRRDFDEGPNGTTENHGGSRESKVSSTIEEEDAKQAFKNSRSIEELLSELVQNYVFYKAHRDK